MDETGGGGGGPWLRKASRGSSLRTDLLAADSLSSSTASSSSSLSSSSVRRGGRVASAINSLQREKEEGGGGVGGDREAGVSNRGESTGGYGGKGNSVRENRRMPLGWGTAQTREGLARGDSVTRVSLRREGEQQFYKHSVAESDSESTGYASISFSDSDTGSDDQGGETSTVVIGEEEEEEEEQERVVMLDLEKELEGVKDGGDGRQGGGAGVAPGPMLTGSVSKPLAGSVAKPQGHVGFSSLPDQVYKRALRRGFELVLMVVGQSGLGKSTLVNSMFLTDVYSSEGRQLERSKETVRVEEHKVELEEGGVRLKLTVVDTPGFGDFVDNSNCWKPVVEYIHQRFANCLEEETRVERPVRPPDHLVHACLYFLPPTGHGLRKIDIEAIRSLHDKVNVIPVLSKSDAFTTEEVDRMKQRVRQELLLEGIQCHSFLEGEEEPPYAVIGGNSVLEKGGRKGRGRIYPWGIVDIEDPTHCDFSLLRRLLLSSHTQDLIDRTHSVHYENYRAHKLRSLAVETGCLDRFTGDGLLEKNPLAVIADLKLEHQEKVAAMEEEMEEVFRKKVVDKEDKMRTSEEEETEKMVREMKLIAREKEALAERREEVAREQVDWDERKTVSAINLASSSSSLNTRKKHLSLSIRPFKFGRS